MTSPVATEENPRVIDLWGFLTMLWAERLVWLGVFVVVFAIGGVAVTNADPVPPEYEVTQTIVLVLPPVNGQAEALQQSGALNEATMLVFAREALRPPVTDAVLASHPEITFAELQARVTATPVGNTLEIRSHGEDPAAEAELVSDLTMSFREQLPTLTKENPEPLRYKSTVWSDPTIVLVNPVASGGRTFSLVSAAALAALIATLAAAVRGSRRRR